MAGLDPATQGRINDGRQARLIVSPNSKHGIARPLQWLAIAALAIAAFLFRDNSAALNILMIAAVPVMLIVAVAYWIWSTSKSL